jgi:DNA-binding Xre family transcriptional regulator
MAATTAYRWHLRRLMAGKDMYATTQLGPLLAERGITLSREQVYRLVTGIPERLSLATLAALCDILGCQPDDLIEPVAGPAGGDRQAAGPAATGSVPLPRPVRARVTGAARG